MDSITINDFVIGYLEKSKGYRFYCPNHSTRRVEIGNARFIENGEVSGSEEPRKVEIKEVRVSVSYLLFLLKMLFVKLLHNLTSNKNNKLMLLLISMKQ